MSHRTLLRTPPGGRVNDVNLIRHRTTHNGNQIRNLLELMSEDKASRYRLEETYCSIPGSVKSTFLITFSPDGQRVASTHGDHRIYICDLITGKLLETLEGHPRTPWCLAWHPINKEILASGCLAGEVRVWDLRSKACETWTTEQNSVIASLAFHPRDRVLVIATSNEIHFWDWSLSKPFATASTSYEKEKVRFVKFDSSGTKLITGISNLPKLINYTSDTLQNRILDAYSSVPAPLFDFSERQNSNNESPPDSTRDSSQPATRTHQTNLIQQRPIGTPTNHTTNSDTQAVHQVNDNRSHTVARIASIYRKLENLEESSRFIQHSFAMSTPSETDLIDISTNPGEPSPILLGRPGRPSTSAALGTQHLPSSSKNVQAAAPNFGYDSSRPSDESGPNRARRHHHSGRQSNNEPFQIGSACVDIQSRSFEDSLNELFDRMRHLSSLESFDERLHMVSSSAQIESTSQDSSAPSTGTLTNQNHSQDLSNQVNPSQRRLSKILTSLKLYCHLSSMTISSSDFRQSQPTSQSNQSIGSAPVMANGSTFLDNSTFQQNPNSASTSLSHKPDPVYALQFRSSARNVPLMAACNLLCARLAVITQSQHILEQAMGLISGNEQRHLEMGPQRTHNLTTQSTSDPTTISDLKGGHFLRSSQPRTRQNLRSATINAGASRPAVDSRSVRDGIHGQTINNNDHQSPLGETIYSSLNRLFQALQDMNYSTLTVCVAREHINRVRRRVDEVLQRLIGFNTNYTEQARHIYERIQFIAQRFTGRDASSPIGERIEHLRLDLIHCLCLADLTIHFARQVQFVQLSGWRMNPNNHNDGGNQPTAGRQAPPLSSSMIVNDSRNPLSSPMLDQPLAYRLAVEQLSAQQLFHITSPHIEFVSRGASVGTFDPSLIVARLLSEPPGIDPIASYREGVPLVITPPNNIDMTDSASQTSPQSSRDNSSVRNRPNQSSLKRKNSSDEHRDSGAKKRKIHALDDRFIEGACAMARDIKSEPSINATDPSCLTWRTKSELPNPDRLEQAGPSGLARTDTNYGDSKKGKLERTVSTRSMTRAQAVMKLEGESTLENELVSQRQTRSSSHSREPTSRVPEEDLASRPSDNHLSSPNFMAGLMPALIVPPIHQLTHVNSLPRGDALIGHMPVLRLIGSPFYSPETAPPFSPTSNNSIARDQASELQASLESRSYISRPLHSQFLVRIYPRALSMFDPALGLIRATGRLPPNSDDSDPMLRPEHLVDGVNMSNRTAGPRLTIGSGIYRPRNYDATHQNGSEIGRTDPSRPSSNFDNPAIVTDPTYSPSQNVQAHAPQSRNYTDSFSDAQGAAGVPTGSAIWRSIPLTGNFVTRDSGRASYLHMQQAPGGQHLWWNTFGLTAVPAQSNYRIQCWDFKRFNIPNIKDSQTNIVSRKCRIHNDASIDISNDGQLLACLVPQDNTCAPSIDFKIFSLNSKDFGTCYYRWSYGPNAISVSLSPLGRYVVVGLTCQKLFANESTYDTM
ncbi:Activating molecule in BECN1-regulated autophagy protein 1, partial [Fragariocoptes setiger]